MRIFDRVVDYPEFEQLVVGMVEDEHIVYRVDDSQYIRYIVYRKDDKGNFPLIGGFHSLTELTKYIKE